MSKQTTELVITGQGGIEFDVTLFGDFVGRMEFGTIGPNGQYQQDDEEIIDEARDKFNIPEHIPAIVR